jgi:hypothetical protein
MGNGGIPIKWFGDFAPEVVPMSNASRGQRRPEIFEGVDELLRERKPHIGIDPNEFYNLKEVRPTV